MNLTTTLSHKVMAQMARYLATYNTESQVLTQDATTTDVQTTGTKVAFFDGNPIKVAADAAMDPAAETNESVTAWANNTSMSLNGINSANSQRGSDLRYRCILAHTSNTLENAPDIGTKWETYWVREPHNAYTANAATVNAGNTRAFLFLANRSGTISTALCGDDANSTTGFTLKIPHFDPFTYVPLGFYWAVNADGDNYADPANGDQFVFGTNDFNSGNETNITGNFHNLTTPIFPHIDNLDVS